MSSKQHFSFQFAQEWFEKHKNLPTLEQIEKVWELNPPGEAPTNSATPEEKAKHVEDQPNMRKSWSFSPGT